MLSDKIRIKICLDFFWIILFAFALWNPLTFCCKQENFYLDFVHWQNKILLLCTEKIIFCFCAQRKCVFAFVHWEHYILLLWTEKMVLYLCVLRKKFFLPWCTEKKIFLLLCTEKMLFCFCVLRKCYFAFVLWANSCCAARWWLSATSSRVNLYWPGTGGHNIKVSSVISSKVSIKFKLVHLCLTGDLRGTFQYSAFSSSLRVQHSIAVCSGPPQLSILRVY